MSNSGVLIFAQNNEKVDYVLQAIFSATRIKNHLNLPVSLITNPSIKENKNYDLSVFDTVIDFTYSYQQNYRRYNDGSLSSTVANFKNLKRSSAYELSPYEKTLIVDSDFLVSNSNLTHCFNNNAEIAMYSKSYDLSGHRKTNEFEFVSDNSVKFYWATVVYFKKSPISKIFFDLIKHIEDEWEHYCMVYQINSPMFRNDFAFSIAAHILNGFIPGDFVQELPGKLYYTIDKDYIVSVDNEKLTFLVEKEGRLGEYNILSTNGLNIHAMNKFNLSRLILDKGI